MVDSMLLVLLVAGRTDVDIVGKHARLDAYSVSDFDLLSNLIADLGGVVWVTPNTLTEASNLIGQHGSPEREQLWTTMRNLIDESHELLIRSSEAAANPLFLELGLTDAALLEIASSQRPLVTVDGLLYATALTDDSGSALNFNHYREYERTTS